MTAHIAIPARHGSSRYRGKPLALIRGKPLIRWTWEQACRAGMPVAIVTDNPDIAWAAEDFGATVVMTSDAANGTARCAQALGARVFAGAEIIINWQGDAPLMPPEWPMALLWKLRDDPEAQLATIAVKGPAHPGSVALALGLDDRALSFGRVDSGMRLLHQGIYAYRRAALLAYLALPETAIERELGLEQARWRAEHPIAVSIQPPPAWPLHEVNYPGDAESVGAVLSRAHAVAQS